MKKTDFFRMAILLIGLWAAYQGILMAGYLLINLVQEFVLSNNIFRGSSQYLVTNTILGLIYGLVAYIAFTKNDYILSLMKVNDDFEENQLNISKQELMYVVLVGIGLYFFIPAISTFVYDLFLAFKEKIRNDFDKPSPVDLVSPFLNIVMPFLLIIFARKLALRFYGEKTSKTT